ncbi:MAG: type II toxin-antitoxin system VapC family toxin [Solirubrobacteraceae bacterium]
MTVVVDASSVAAYLLGEASDGERDALLGEPHAPCLVDVEVTQTLRGLLRGGTIHLATADVARSELGELGVRRHPDVPLLRRAWELRDVATTYDALYVALAEALDAPLHTRDGRLARGVRGLVDVRLTA